MRSWHAPIIATLLAGLLPGIALGQAGAPDEAQAKTEGTVVGK